MTKKRNIYSANTLSLRKGILLFLLLILCISPSCVFADGGTLKFRQSLPDEEISPWTSENYNAVTEQKAMMRLDKEKAEEVYVFNYRSNKNSGKSDRVILVTQSKPPRLFFDLNGDKTFQPDEIYSAQPIHLNSTDPIYNVKNVKLPLLDDHVQPIAETDIQIFQFKKKCRFYVEKIRSCYEGKLLLDGKEYLTRMILLSPVPYPMRNNEVVILDINQDGKFNPFEDCWFTNQKTVFIDGRNWNLSTEFNESEVNIQLTPYTGPTGKLVIEGENFHRLYLDKYDSTGHMICLPVCDELTYTLPTGLYRINKLWLKTDNSKEFLENYNSIDTGDSLSFGSANSGKIQIKKSETETIQLNGKLKNTLKAIPSLSSGNVILQYNGFRSISRFSFLLVSYESGKFNRSTGPKWEIRNAKNVVIASGCFEYG